MAAFAVDPATAIRELKVSGYTMHLAPGLYCVLNSPSSARPAEASLPAIRLSPAPGQNGGVVSIVGFDAEGWLHGGDGNLVRVGQPGGEVLVTIYQDPQAPADPPQLQVIRVSADPSPGPPPPDTLTPEVFAHIYGLGDVPGTLGAWIGEPGSGRWIEGFSVNPADPALGPDMEYQAVLGRGWLSPWVEAGQFCGSRGMSLPILGLRVRLRGKPADTHRLHLSARFVDGTEIGPVSADEPCEAPSFAALEAFRLSFEASAPSSPAIRPRPTRRR